MDNAKHRVQIHTARYRRLSGREATCLLRATRETPLLGSWWHQHSRDCGPHYLSAAGVQASFRTGKGVDEGEREQGAN